MPLEFDIRIEGAEQLQADWTGKLPSLYRQKLVEAMLGITTDLAGDVRAAAPTGKTGKLASTIRSQVSDKGGTVIGAVQVMQFYSRFIEGGVNWSGQVKGYIRTIPKSAVWAQVYGKRGQALKRKRLASIGIGTVRSYARRVVIPPRPFLGPAFAARKADIEARLGAALAAACDEVSA